MVDAVRCAVLIQEGMAEREINVAEAERIRFRIGVDLDDMIHEADGDLYGDGVNVAARLEQLCEPGDSGLRHRLRAPPGQARPAVGVRG